jgi:hypothetical protein
MHAGHCIPRVFLHVLAPHIAKVATFAGKVEADIGHLGWWESGYYRIVLAGYFTEELSVLTDLN